MGLYNMRLSTSTLAIVILVGLLACLNDDAGRSVVHDDPSITSLNGRWKVVSFEDYTQGTTEFKTQENSWDRDITITFNDTKHPHELSGSNITNTITGKFEYVSSRKFTVHSLFSTEVNQPTWADQFTDALLDADKTFKINHFSLRIFYSNNTKSVTLERQ